MVVSLVCTLTACCQQLFEGSFESLICLETLEQVFHRTARSLNKTFCCAHRTLIAAVPADPFPGLVQS